MMTAGDILDVLDHGAESYAVPMLDNGYLYLAATRMALYRSNVDWAIVVEVFGFSPRAGLPYVCVSTLASRLRDRDPPESYVSRDAYENYLSNHLNDESRFFYPISEGTWLDSDRGEFVSESADDFILRDEVVKIPRAEDFSLTGIVLSEPPRVLVFELCRLAAERYRERVLATQDERRVSVPGELTEVLRLDEWAHPNLVEAERPSEHETFQQISQVLASGDPTRYRPTATPNTHWRNWPDGGSL